MLLKFWSVYFIYFWLHWDFIAAHGLSLVAKSMGLLSKLCARSSLLWLLICRASGFSSCSSQALEFRVGSLMHRVSCLAACVILVPRPEIEPMFPAFAPGFLTSGLPGKFLSICFICSIFLYYFFSDFTCHCCLLKSICSSWMGLFAPLSGSM